MKREHGGGSERAQKKRRITAEASAYERVEVPLPEGSHLISAETEPVQYHCDYCRKDISNSIRVRCAICAEFDLCVECFSVGVELKGHQNNHDYRVIDNMHFPFLCKDWSADEEQLLLEGLELYGYGNWSDIADHVSTKDRKACRDHYEKYYLKSTAWPLPDYSKLLCTPESIKMLNSGKYSRFKRPDGIVVKKEIQQKTKPGPKLKGPKFQAQPPVRSDLAGYMPMREEFETEYDNECENKIKDLAFEDDDTPEEFAHKMTLVESYNYRLQVRRQRRQYVVERGLHDLKLQERKNRARNKEEKEMHKKLKQFLQILTPEEYDEFIAGLAREKQLRAKVKMLQDYRRKGIKTFAEAAKYEEEKRKRESIKTREKTAYARKTPQKKQPLDLSGQPGLENLSVQERELCEHCHILPNQYFIAKEALLREYVKTGELPIPRALQLVKLDNVKIMCILEFMQTVGWINNKSHVTIAPPKPPPNAVPPSSTATTPTIPLYGSLPGSQPAHVDADHHHHQHHQQSHQHPQHHPQHHMGMQ